MAKQAIRRVYYEKDLRTFTFGKNPPSTTLVDAVRMVYIKPANVKMPIIGGWRKPAAWSLDDLRYDAVPTGHWRYFSSVWVDYRGRLPLSLDPMHTGLDYGPPARLEGQTVIKALNKMRQNAVNLGVAFGERREAASMIRDRAVTLVRAVRELRKGNLRSFRQALGLRPGTARNATTRSQAREIAGQVPQLWLEHQYGWKPLLGDVHTAIERYADNNYRDPTRLYASVKASTETSRDMERSFSPSGGIVAECTDRVSNRCFVRIDYRPDSDFDHLKSPEEWGILNPFVVAWELVPFSFVADWFLPVGDWLNAMTAAAPYKFKDGSCTHFTRASSQCTLKVTQVDPSGSISYQEASGSGSLSRVFMTRKVYTDFPYASFASLAPHASSASTQSIFTRAANALSILASTFKGR